MKLNNCLTSMRMKIYKRLKVKMSEMSKKIIKNYIINYVALAH